MAIQKIFFTPQSARRVSLTLMALFLLWSGTAAAESKDYVINQGDLDRTYSVYQPSGLDPKTPAPLVIVLHGGFGSGRQAEKSYAWDGAADKNGFVVAYPDGIRRSWNAGGTCCGRAAENNVDDIGFITQIIRDVSKKSDIDPKRIYLTGMSNGAAMSYRYACEGPYPIAAVGAVSGSFSFSCNVTRPVSVMEIHGIDDQLILMKGGASLKGKSKTSWLPVEETIGAFRKAAHCPAPTIHQQGPVHTEKSACPANHDVTLITIDGAGHQWPGSADKPGLIVRMFGLDKPSMALDATATLWDFFKAHPAP